MNIRFLILWLALGLLAAGGCSKAYEIKVLTDFNRSAEFSCVSHVCSFGDDGQRDRDRGV